ncbi:hypothetical protein D3C71_1413600 [compost metagenome]
MIFVSNTHQLALYLQGFIFDEVSQLEQVFGHEVLDFLRFISRFDIQPIRQRVAQSLVNGRGHTHYLFDRDVAGLLSIDQFAHDARDGIADFPLRLWRGVVRDIQQVNGMIGIGLGALGIVGAFNLLDEAGNDRCISGWQYQGVLLTQRSNLLRNGIGQFGFLADEFGDVGHGRSLFKFRV